MKKRWCGVILPAFPRLAVLVYVFAISALAFVSSCGDDSTRPEGTGPIVESLLPNTDAFPAWSPDGSSLLYIHSGIAGMWDDRRAIIDPDSVGLWIVDADGRNPRMLRPGVSYASWSPDGAWIVFDAGQLFKARLTATGVDSVQQLTFSGRNHFPSWSPDGEWIAYDSNVGSNGGFKIWIMRADGTAPRNITAAVSGEVRAPNWGPTGSQIAHIRFPGGETFSSEVFLMDSHGASAQRLTWNATTDRFPRFSPTGDKIAFWAGSSPDYGIWVMNTDGSSPYRLVVGNVPSWSPDGKRIAFVGFPPDPRDRGTIWTIGLGGSDLRQITFGPRGEGK